MSYYCSIVFLVLTNKNNNNKSSKCTTNLLTDTVPHQVIPQYENVDMITNTLPTTELEMNTCTTYGVIELYTHSYCLC